MRKILVLLFMIYSISFSLKGEEQRIKIAVVDSGSSRDQINSKSTCENGVIDKIESTGIDTEGHGTNIYGIIDKKMNNKTHCIVIYKVWKKSLDAIDITLHIASAIKHATKTRVKFINLSIGGEESHFKERAMVKRAINKGIFVITAAGNNGDNLDKECDYYPACYKEDFPSDFLRVVSANDLKASNYGKIVTNKERGKNVEGAGITRSGTSQATAILTSKLINK